MTLGRNRLFYRRENCCLPALARMKSETLLAEIPAAKKEQASYRKRIVWLAVGCLALGAAFWLDAPVDAALQGHSNPALQATARALTRVGEWWAVGAAGIILTTFFFLQGAIKTAHTILTVTLAGVGTGLVATVLRTLIGRARPSAAVAQGFYGPYYHSHWIVGQYQFASFPSGHAATLAGLAVAAWMVHRPTGLWLGLFAAAVSWSRVAQSSHHFSDIVAAALLGLWLAPRLLKGFHRLTGRVFEAAARGHLERKSQQAPSHAA